MSNARCTECGGEAPREPRSYIRHEPGCSEVLTFIEQHGGPPAVVTAHVTAIDPQAEPYSLAEAEVIARHAGKLNWWAGRIMRELDTVRAKNVELRKLLDEERRERREQT